MRASPKIYMTTNKQEQELNVNDLISQYSESKPAANASVKQEIPLSSPNVSSAQRIPKHSDPNAKSQASSLGSPTKVTTPVKNGTQNGHHNNSSSSGKLLGGRHHSNESVSETSEGEVFEDAPAKSIQPQQPQQPKETQLNQNMSKGDEQLSRTPRHEKATKPVHDLGPRDNSPPSRALASNPKPQLPRSRDERRDELDSRSDRRYRPDYQIERKQYPESDKRINLRRDSRDEEYRRPEPIVDPPREDYSRQPREQEQQAPTLNELLPHDNDLREWLEITGYHNAPYRNKILIRRRAIADLDAQRERLLAEMEAEERGGLPIAIRGQTPASSMLPPPLPNKAGVRTEPTFTPSEKSMVDTQRDRVVSNKRSYSDVQDPRDEPTGVKVARIDDQPYSQRIKAEEEMDSRRPRIKEEEVYRRPPSSGFETSRRSSIDARGDRYDVRGRSRERELSPSRRGYESWPAVRSRPYDEDPPYRDERPYEISRGYKGRGYELSYRGRGRGRARDSAYDRYAQEPDSKNETSFGARIANSRPYKDPKGFDKGGKGGP
jgi:YTH domain-containing protein 1